MLWMHGAFVAALGLAGEVEVFGDALAPEWQDWSWSAQNDFANPRPTWRRSAASIRVDLQEAWAGFYLQSSESYSVVEHPALRLRMHGGDGGQSLWLSVVGTAGTSAAIDVGPLVAGEWQRVRVPVAGLGVGEVTGFFLMDAEGRDQAPFFVDAVVLESSPFPPDLDRSGLRAGPALSVHAFKERRPISPDIYGMSFADEALAQELELPVHRWGGNTTTRYSWLHDISNRASDWYFESIPNDNDDPSQLPSGSDSDEFIEADLARGTRTLLTVPTIGWSAKDREWRCGFSVAKYGAQQDSDPYRPDCGNGVDPNGEFITGNDPADTSVTVDPTFARDWVQHLQSQFGEAEQGGVRFFALDNEPMLWNSTHRDIHPQPAGYDEVRDRSIDYAGAILGVEPSAELFGPVVWGWTAYFYSALDAAGGGSWWLDPPDRNAHGGIPFVEWYLQEMAAHEQASGARHLHYLDLHYYPQAPGVALAPSGDEQTQRLRLRTTRSLYDPSYIDESWIAEPVRLLPRMREWVDANYPGTKLAITEYNFGGLESLNGALTQAEVLGLFGKYGLDLACLWGAPAPEMPGTHAFRMFRNYDGAGARFGETHVRATSDDRSAVSIFAAQRRTDQTVTVLFVNKGAESLVCPVTTTFGFAEPDANVWTYDARDLDAIVSRGSRRLSGDGAEEFVVLPAESLTLWAVSSR